MARKWPLYDTGCTLPLCLMNLLKHTLCFVTKKMTIITVIILKLKNKIFMYRCIIYVH
jgi:hypothetical protein